MTIPRPPSGTRRRPPDPPKPRQRTFMPWLFTVMIVVTLFGIRRYERAAAERKAQQLEAKLVASDAAYAQLSGALQRAQQSAVAAETSRQRDRFRFLINSAKEWELHAATSRLRLTGAAKLATEQGWDQQEVTGLLANLAARSTLPIGAKATLLAIDRTVPAVALTIGVTDRQGLPVAGLGRQDFQVFRGDRELRHFSVAASLTTLAEHSIAIVVDCSGSMQGERLKAAQTAIRELRAVRGPNTRFTLIAFAADATREVPLTTDWQLIESQVDRLKADGATALYRGLSVATSELATGPGVKSVVVMTDGEDTVGGVSLDQAIAACRQADISVHVVGFAGPELDQQVLRRIAAETKGGLHLASTPKSCAEALQAITKKLAVPAYHLVVLDTSDLTDNLDIMVGGAEGLRLRVGSANATRVSQMESEAKH